MGYVCAPTVTCICLLNLLLGKSSPLLNLYKTHNHLNILIVEFVIFRLTFVLCVGLCLMVVTKLQLSSEQRKGVLYQEFKFQS